MLIIQRAGIVSVLALLFVFISSPVLAVAVDKPLQDRVLEARARGLHKQLRCLVCQNQSIEDSNADLARDLRMLVRERLTLGDSDQQVLDFIVARYGNWVMLKPPLNIGTLLLWFGPLILLSGITLFVLLRLRRARDQSVAAVADLSAEDEARIKNLLDESLDH